MSITEEIYEPDDRNHRHGHHRGVCAELCRSLARRFTDRAKVEHDRCESQYSAHNQQCEVQRAHRFQYRVTDVASEQQHRADERDYLCDFAAIYFHSSMLSSSAWNRATAV